MSKKRPSLAKVVHTARKVGLFALAEGTGDGLHYTFWDEKTGKCVLIYYVDTGRYLVPGSADKGGTASDFREAMAAAGLRKSPEVLKKEWLEGQLARERGE